MSNYVSIPIIDKASCIIDCLCENEMGLPARQLLQKTDIPRTTFYRLLNSLVENGYLRFNNSNGLFFLGPKFTSASMAVDEKRQALKTIAMPLLHDLAEQVQDTAKLSVLSRYHCFVLGTAEGPKSIRISVDTGASFPLHAGAASKILMSSLEATEIHRYFSKPIEKYTPLTITNEQDMLAAIQELQRQGYATDEGEYIPEIGAVAYPVLDPSGDIIAAISVAFPTANKVNITQLVANLRDCADRICQGLAGLRQGPPPSTRIVQGKSL